MLVMYFFYMTVIWVCSFEKKHEIKPNAVLITRQKLFIAYLDSNHI